MNFIVSRHLRRFPQRFPSASHEAWGILWFVKKRLTSPPAQLATAAFTTALPVEFVQRIGSVMVYWAFFEMRLQELVFRALGVTDKQGRLAVKSMRASEMAKLADELLVISGEAIPWQLNSDAIKLLEERRNLLAHGVWLEHQGTLFLRDLTGSVVINGARVKKKIQPAGIPITIDALGNLADQIQQAIEDTQRAMSALHAQRQASRQTPP